MPDKKQRILWPETATSMVAVDTELIELVGEARTLELCRRSLTAYTNQALHEKYGDRVLHVVYGDPKLVSYELIPTERPQWFAVMESGVYFA